MTLLEATDALGGQILAASRAPKREDYKMIADWLARQVDKAGVDVRCGVSATAAEVLALEPDAVVVATGATARVPDLPGVELPHVVTTVDVLLGRVTPGRRVVVVDEDGHYAAPTTADLLAGRGYLVTLISRYFMVGEDIDEGIRSDLYARLFGQGVVLQPLTAALAIVPGGLRTRHTFSGAEATLEADTVVLSFGGKGQRQPLPRARWPRAGAQARGRRGVAPAHPRRHARRHSRRPRPVIPRTASVVVIGGGAVGCSIAYHLARRGVRDVVVLERETVGSGTTSKAAGGIRAQFGTETEIRFSLEGQRVLESFKEEFGGDPGFQRIGYLFLISSPADLRAFETRIALQRRLGVDVRVITPKEAQAIVPSLFVDDLVAAVWGPRDGVAGPAEVTAGFARRARELGARIVEGVETTGLTLEAGQVRGVRTSDGDIAVPVVVNAAGPAAARVGRLAGLALPVYPRRRHIFYTEPFPEIPGPVPITTDTGSGFYFRKEMEQLLLSPGDVKDIGDDQAAPVDWAMMEEAVGKAVHRVPVIERARIAGGWAGLRPLTPDDHAILGWAPGVEGFFWPSGGAVTASSTRPPRAGSSPSGSWTAGLPWISRSSIPLASTAGRRLSRAKGRAPGARTRSDRRTLYHRRELAR